MKNHNRNKWLNLFFCALTLLSLPIWLNSQALAALSSPIIVDHTCTNLPQVPQAWIEQAKTNLRVAYQHTSHGSQLITGISAFRGSPGSAYYYTYSDNVYNAAVFLNDHGISGAGDLGNPDRTTWDTATRNLLNRVGGCNRNVIIWSWCGQVDGTAAQIADDYLARMYQLETNFPGVQFVYMTGHLNGTAAAGNVNQRNEQIRTYCETHNKILFDFADIESYDPDGLINYMPLGCDDGCTYSVGAVSHNWASEWIAAHPGSELTGIAATICSGCCQHSQALNCVLKGRAFWWLMARLAGWNGIPGPTYTISGIVTLEGTTTPLQGVIMDGLPGNPLSSTTGYYSALVSEDWSGTVTPTLTDYTFTPDSRTYPPVTADQPDQDYAAAHQSSIEINGGGGGGGGGCFISIFSGNSLPNSIIKLLRKCGFIGSSN